MVKESTVGRCSCSETNRDNLTACSGKGACDKGKVHERLMLFGIRIDGGGGGGGDGDEREMMRKSFSMGNLMACADPSSGDHGYLSDGLVHSSSNRKRPERKRGVPWTEEEHRTFLAGLEKLGKGDWRGISRKFVTTRTPTQVASHAQKYFLRQASHKKKRRSSLFDLVTTNVGGSSIDMNDKPVSVITNALAHLPLAMDSDISDPKKMLVSHSTFHKL